MLGDDESRARLQRLEAILFLAREPLSSRKLSQFANLADGTQARTLVRRLNENYDQLGRAFRVEEVGGGFQLLSRRKFASWLRRLTHVPPELRLSAPAMETLAVIAYRQPVLRADIEAIRGVSCGEILRQLMDRDLVRISGRSDELGRPFLYSTTRRFLQTFGLHSLDNLPRVEQLRKGAAGETEDASEDPSDSLLDRPMEDADVSVLTPPEISSAKPSDDETSPPLSAVPTLLDDEEEDEEEYDEEEYDDEYEDDEGDADEDDYEDEDDDYEEEDDELDDDELDDDEDASEWEEVGDDEEEEDEDVEDEEWGDEWDDEDDDEYESEEFAEEDEEEEEWE